MHLEFLEYLVVLVDDLHPEQPFQLMDQRKHKPLYEMADCLIEKDMKI